MEKDKYNVQAVRLKTWSKQEIFTLFLKLSSLSPSGGEGMIITYIMFMRKDEKKRL